ncbi:MAG TPA: hypothetical protein VF912_00255 [Anaeromyxobacter sp.]
MIFTALLASLLAAPAAGSEASPAEGADGTQAWTLGHVKLGAYAGGFDGRGVRTASGGAALVEGTAAPTMKTGAWKLDVPLRFHHFQTFGASLSETYGSASVGIEDRVAKALRLGASLGLSGAWRPDWPDLYQPQANNPSPSGGFELTPTNRYSYLAWHAGASLGVTPFARNHLRLKYQYVHTGYVRDPNFRLDRPMHLTPRDNGQHRLESSWRAFGDGYAVAARFEYVHRQDEVYLARNAVTGLTNFYTTPYQRLDRMEPSVEVTVKRLADRLDVSLQYGYQIQDDLYQGYYSYSGHHPRLTVEYAFTERFSARVEGEAWLLEYGPSSKAAGLPPDPTVPGRLENGTRLYDRRGAVGATASYAFTKRLAAKLKGEWVRRSTNYPDYVPGYYPSTKLYDIEWRYVNTLVVAGVELRL